MAAFRGFSRKGNLGDLKSEVALLRADLNSLNDELGYLLRNLGTDNMNPAELAAFLAERDLRLDRAFAALNERCEESVSAAELAALGRRLSEAVLSLHLDMDAVFAEGERTSKNGKKEKSAFERWREGAETRESFGAENAVSLGPGEVTELLSVAVPPGRYLVFGGMEVEGENLYETRPTLFSRGRGGGEESTGPVSVFRGEGDSASLSCSAAFELKNGGTLLLLSDHGGKREILCKGAFLTALSLEGSP